jgi:hypothetical protein
LKQTPYECYTIYLALKQHFSNENYDFLQYNGKVRTSIKTYNKRNDRYFFEKLSRKYDRQEIIEYFVASFIHSDNPSSLWIGDLKSTGDEIYTSWKANIQALTYRFTEDLKKLTESQHLYECIQSNETKHPSIIKAFLRNDITLETLFILEDILHFMKESDYDPILKTINFKIKKYRPFFEYNKSYFIEQMKTICYQKT